MAAEDAGGSELAQLVSDHIFRNIYGDEFVAVVYGDGLTHEIGRNHGSPGPSLDRDFLVGLLRLNNSFFQFVENVRTFL